MLERPQFHIEPVETGLNYGRYKAEPMEPGYGTTMGNALRRILLRSLEGVAVSRIRIDNVWHEFSTVPGVREDVTEIVLNLKRIRLKRLMELNGEARAHLYVRGDSSGERVVTAGDVVWPAEVDVINPDQVIATLDGTDGVIDMDLWITQDRGYKPAELQESFSIGEIPIDAIYTPIERVNFVVEHTRVGPMTDYDRLIIEVLTDGTIEPDDALAESAQILVRQAQVFAGLNQVGGPQAATSGVAIPEEIMNKPLADLGLSPRVLNALRSRQIERVGQVLTTDPDQLLTIRNFGPRSLTELRQKLSEYGYLPEGDNSFASSDLLDGLELAEDGLDLADDELSFGDDGDPAEWVAGLGGEQTRSTAGIGEE
ncbi:MAG: DNA-directed RNA polymerase subunit alpha [Thermomicrobiales bacterium]